MNKRPTRKRKNEKNNNNKTEKQQQQQQRKKKKKKNNRCLGPVTRAETPHNTELALAHFWPQQHSGKAAATEQAVNQPSSPTTTLPPHPLHPLPPAPLQSPAPKINETPPLAKWIYRIDRLCGRGFGCTAISLPVASLWLSQTMASRWCGTMGREGQSPSMSMSPLQVHSPARRKWRWSVRV